MSKFNWTDFGIDKKLSAIDRDVMSMCQEYFDIVEDIRDTNQLKVLNSFIELEVGAQHLQGSTGYGYGDIGRDMFDKVFAKSIGAEDALCRTQFMSGTHAITVMLFGVLRQNMTMLSITGTPYNTLRQSLGLGDAKGGSLHDYGIKYKQIELDFNGNIDIDEVIRNIDDVDMVYIQRSRGYSIRNAVSPEEIGRISSNIKDINSSVIIAVDNCYGEFTSASEPTEFGADIMAGSFIKNPGGGIAETGGYIAGKNSLVELCAERLTAPGVGREIGSNILGYRNMFLGLYMSPHITCEALKGSIYSSALFELAGYKVSPSFSDSRNDIITSIEMGSENKLMEFCKAIQSTSPIDSYAVPVPGEMPGYETDVIMASGSFTNGSSIELSCDAPVAPPYNVYVQGGLNLVSTRYALLKALSILGNNNDC